MTLTWSGRRQLLYSGVGAIIVFILLIFIYETYFTAPPTCSDGKQNGDERGIDCGGSCALVCAADAHAPVVSWARAFRTSTSTYNAVAYVQNNNVGAGALGVQYSFQLFDAANILIAERDGVTNIPPLRIVPITESNINTGSRIVARTLFAFTNDPPAVWNKVPAGSYPQLTVTQPTHNDNYSRLDATLVNNNVGDVKTVAVVAIIYDADDVALATSKSVLQRVAGRSQQQVVFTWQGGVSGAVRFEIIVIPAF